MLRLAVLLGAVASVQAVYYYTTCHRDLIQYAYWRKERHAASTRASGAAYYNKYYASQYAAELKAASAMGNYAKYVRLSSVYLAHANTYRALVSKTQAKINAHKAVLAAYKIAQEKVWINAFNAGKGSRDAALKKIEIKANLVRVEIAAMQKVSKDIKAWQSLYSKQIRYIKNDLVGNNRYWNSKTYGPAMKRNSQALEFYDRQWKMHAEKVLKFYKSNLFVEFHKWAVAGGASALREKGWYTCGQNSRGVSIRGFHQTAGCSKPKDYSKTIPSYSQTKNLIGYYDSAVLLKSRSTTYYTKYMKMQDNELSAMKYRAMAILQLAGTWDGEKPLVVQDNRE